MGREIGLLDKRSDALLPPQSTRQNQYCVYFLASVKLFVTVSQAT